MVKINLNLKSLEFFFKTENRNLINSVQRSDDHFEKYKAKISPWDNVCFSHNKTLQDGSRGRGPEAPHPLAICSKHTFL